MSQTALDNALGHMWKKLRETYLINFYLWTITMTTVGYGDSVSMPDMEDYKSDYWVMSIHIIASVFAFYLC